MKKVLANSEPSDNPTAPAFVRYWGKSGHRWISARHPRSGASDTGLGIGGKHTAFCFRQQQRGKDQYAIGDHGEDAN